MYPQDTTTSNNQQQEKRNANDACQLFKFTHYVTVDYRPLHSPTLSGVAKALWVFGHSRPPGWVFYFSEIMTHFKEGERSLYNAFNELVKHRLAARFPYQMQMPGSKRWVFAGNEYAFFDKEVNDLELNEIRESLKKRFQNRRFLHPQNEDPQNDGLIKIKDISNEDKKENNAPAEADAKPSFLSSSSPKIPYRTALMIERVPNHSAIEEFKKCFNTPLVGISEENHQELISKHGESVVKRAYEALADWKISKAQMEPKVVNKHTDIQRLKKWVIKEILDKPIATAGGYKRTGKLAIQADITAMEELKANPRPVNAGYEYEMKSLEKFAKDHKMTLEKAKIAIHGSIEASDIYYENLKAQDEKVKR